METELLKRAIKGQYHSALAMLRQVIELCPDPLWIDEGQGRSFWRVAYHCLFYTDLYLQPSEAEFKPWPLHRERVADLSRPSDAEPYSRDQMLDYWSSCDGRVNEAVDRLDLEADECGFWWYEMQKLDHQLMNIRHVQQHTGQLSERLMAAGVDTDWVG